MARTTITKCKIEEMAEIINRYTDSENLPILKEVCFLNSWDFDNIMKLSYEYEVLGLAIKKLCYKKEAQLEREVYNGKFNSQMAIFSLRQMGWRNEPEIEKEREKLEIVFKKK